MLWFIAGVAAGVFADRAYPIPVSFVIAKIKAMWGKATSKDEPPTPPGSNTA